MNKPYIVCHMMTSVDGRIDCAMTEHLPGVQEYYDTLDALDAPTRISGRVTAELEMALPGKFEAKTAEALGKEAFSKAADAEGYEIVVDTHGTLLWGESAEDERPLLILTSEQVSKEYLAYLNGKHISWIACGKEHVDLKRACEILAAEFAHFNDDVLFGENWNNEDIDLKTRSIITVVALMAQGITDSSLKFHLQNAKDHGVTQKEIAAIITHVAFYAGWPKGWAVFNLAKEVWNEDETE